MGEEQHASSCEPVPVPGEQRRLGSALGESVAESRAAHPAYATGASNNSHGQVSAKQYPGFTPAQYSNNHQRYERNARTRKPKSVLSSDRSHSTLALERDSRPFFLLCLYPA